MTAPRLARGWMIYDIVKRLPEDSREDFLDELKRTDMKIWGLSVIQKETFGP